MFINLADLHRGLGSPFNANSIHMNRLFTSGRPKIPLHRALADRESSVCIVIVVAHLQTVRFIRRSDNVIYHPIRTIWTEWRWRARAPGTSAQTEATNTKPRAPTTAAAPARLCSAVCAPVRIWPALQEIERENKYYVGFKDFENEHLTVLPRNGVEDKTTVLSRTNGETSRVRPRLDQNIQ